MQINVEKVVTYDVHMDEKEYEHLIAVVEFAVKAIGFMPEGTRLPLGVDYASTTDLLAELVSEMERRV